MISKSLPILSEKLSLGIEYFALTVQPGEKLQLYLKVKVPESLLSVDIILESVDDFKERKNRQNIIAVFYKLYSGNHFFYNMTLIRFSEDRSFLYYATYQIGFMAVNSLYHGIAYQYLPPMSLDSRAQLVWMVAYIPLIFGAQYVTELTLAKENFKRFYLSVQLLAVICLLGIVLGPWLPVSTQVVTFPLLASGLFILGIFLFLKIENIGTLSTFIVGWTGLFIFVGRFLLSALGLLPSGSENIHYLFLGLAWESIFVSFSLGSRITKDVEAKRMVSKVEKGLAPATELQKYFSSPLEKSYAVKQQEISVMFIDIVGYSLTSKILGDHLTFKLLRSRLQKIEKIVEEHYGHVNKNLGDGLICFFGYHSHRNHGRDAIDSAIAVQELSFQPEKSGLKSIILPTRIGINTAKVIVGNVGSQSRADYTLIGDGVNLASRLEQSCNPFRVIFSKSTLEKACLDDLQNYINEIYISIKHHDKPIAAYEYDNNKFQQRKKAELAYYTQLGIQIKSERFPVSLDKLKLSSDFGDMDIHDISRRGIGGSANFYLGINHEFEASLVSSNESINKQLQEVCLDVLKLRVRWSKSRESRFFHGFEVQFLSDKQSHLFMTILAPHIHDKI